MTHSLEGLQFPHTQDTQKPSTSKTGKNILAAALAGIAPQVAQAVLQEKNWRKRYPYYFKALVEHGILDENHALQIAEQGLNKAQASFDFYRDGQAYSLKESLALQTQKIDTHIIHGQSQQAPEWYVPYQGKKLQGDALLAQLDTWQQRGIIEPSHADALREAVAHPEWFDLSDRTLVLFGAGSEAGPFTWLAKWKANIVAIDLPNAQVWSRILKTVREGNATLYAPTYQTLATDLSDDQIASKLGANLLTEIPEIIQWLINQSNSLDLAAIAYLDGEKHVRVAMAMDFIMQQVSDAKPDTSLMFMCTPTDVYAVPQEVIKASEDKLAQRSQLHTRLSKGISLLSAQRFFKPNSHDLIQSNNGEKYGIADSLVVEQGPNYALAKRLQQWRATLARQQGQVVSINIAPSTTTHSVTKNPLLKAAFQGAKLFDVEAFEPQTTNALMAALWIHDLRNPQSVAQPQVKLQHPLELMMKGANHGGLWHVAYLPRTALPFAALYGLAEDKLPLEKLLKKFKI